MPKQNSKSKTIRRVYKLKDRKTFESFIANNDIAVIVAYHYLCPQCETYVKQFKKVAIEYEDDGLLNFAKIHIQLQWMIEKAKLKGDVHEENVFLTSYDVGSKVPATMFFKKGKLIWKIEGVLEPPILRGLIKKINQDSKGNDDIINTD